MPSENIRSRLEHRQALPDCVETKHRHATPSRKPSKACIIPPDTAETHWPASKPRAIIQKTAEFFQPASNPCAAVRNTAKPRRPASNLCTTIQNAVDVSKTYAARATMLQRATEAFKARSRFFLSGDVSKVSQWLSRAKLDAELDSELCFSYQLPLKAKTSKFGSVPPVANMPVNLNLHCPKPGHRIPHMNAV